MKKKRINRKDIVANIIFIITFLFIYLYLTKNDHLFGSTIDFKYQHYLIPEYFRTLFYNFHNPFPDFALNLGGGQNIYYLSYYGLYNPIILISYLFPHLKMIHYIIITSILSVLISTSLFYFFLRKNNYNEKISFYTSFLLLCSGPLIFHAKRHIMFINYFPSLILGLYGIDRYIQNKKSTLLTISIILIILTSYYFSIPSIIVLYLYYIYKLYNKQNNIKLKELTKQIIKFSENILIAILSTTILTLPTLYTLLNGREISNNTIHIKELLTPSITKSLLYSPYSIGLTILPLIALIHQSLKGNKETKIIAIICFLITTFPIFNYLLNGTLYINSKSLIPFTFIFLIITANFLQHILKKNNKIQKKIITLYLLIPLLICINTNINDKLITKTEKEKKETTITEQMIKKITKEDTNDFYRINTETLHQNGINKITNIKEYKTTIYSSTSNKNYIKLYDNIIKNPISFRNKFMLSPNTNIISQMLLSEKYIITKENIHLDLELIEEKEGIKLYKNKNVLPIGYATNKIIDIKTYNNLLYPNKSLTALKYIITEKINNTPNIDIIAPQNLSYTIKKQNKINIEKNSNKYNIKAKKNNYLEIELKDNLKNKILFIQFKVDDNKKNDQTIIINNIKNKLTTKSWKYYNENNYFEYTIQDTNKLNIYFKPGTYKISNIKAYILDYKEIKNIKQTIDQFTIKKIKENKITGTINVTKNNSYFNLNIPYDKGFYIKIDNKIIKYEKSGINSIIFPIKKGKHTIEITYKAPLKRISLIISTIGIILFIIKEIKTSNKKT